MACLEVTQTVASCIMHSRQKDADLRQCILFTDAAGSDGGMPALYLVSLARIEGMRRVPACEEPSAISKPLETAIGDYIQAKTRKDPFNPLQYENQTLQSWFRDQEATLIGTKNVSVESSASQADSLLIPPSSLLPCENSHSNDFALVDEIEKCLKAASALPSSTAKWKTRVQLERMKVNELKGYAIEMAIELTRG